MEVFTLRTIPNKNICLLLKKQMTSQTSLNASVMMSLTVCAPRGMGHPRDADPSTSHRAASTPQPTPVIVHAGLQILMSLELTAVT